MESITRLLTEQPTECFFPLLVYNTVHMKTFDEAVQFLYSAIPKTRKTKFPADRGLMRMRRIMELLNNPQNKLRSIHIAGTSGKGSTATFVSALLTAHGKKTGLHVKPHFIDIRERLQINGRMIAKQKFVHILNKVKQALKNLEKEKFGTATYFELLVAMAFLWFYEEKVDYAVIETGLGGLYDGTNVIDSKEKVVLITPIGLDHTAILGNTITKIALQKAGIIQTDTIVFSSDQLQRVQKVFKQEAQRKNVQLLYVTKHTHYKKILITQTGTHFLYNHSGTFTPYSLGTIGMYQAQNASLALMCIEYLSKRDSWKFILKQAQKTLTTTTIPGRFEKIFYQKKLLILDSAHNPQKIRAFIHTLTKLYPQQKITYCIAIKKDKNSHAMLVHFLASAEHIVITEFAFETMDMPLISSPANTLYLYIPKSHKPLTLIEPDQKKALEKAIALSSGIVVITGSMYLLAAIKQTLLKQT